MLTNFFTIRKAVKKMGDIDKLMESPQFDKISKREKLQIQRERAKLDKNLGSIADLSRLPAAVFIVDILKEHIAVAEAHRLNIPTLAIVDTNSDPNLVDFPIPANDDASKSISVIVKAVCDAIAEGLAERKIDKDNAANDDMDEETAEFTDEANYDDDEKREGRTRDGVRKVKDVAEEGEDGQRKKRPTIKRGPVKAGSTKKN